MGRNAAKCVPFKAKEGSEEPEGDYYQLAAILCAMAGMFWRVSEECVGGAWRNGSLRTLLA